MSGKCGMRNSGGGIVARGGAAARSAAGRTQRVKFEAIAINSVAKKKPTAEDAAHYIGLEHIDPGCFVVSRWGGDVAPIGDKLLMKKGDILFGRRRAYQRKVAIAPFDGIFSAHGMVLRPKTDVVDEKFFPFFIASDQFMNEAIRISVGGLSPTINWGTLKNCEFDLPPMDEQKKLAELLWAANDLKESYKKAITATDEMLKAKFREMFGDPFEEGDGKTLIELSKLGLWESGGTPSRRRADYFEGNINWYSAGELNSLYLPPSVEKITEEAVLNSAAKVWPAGCMLVGMYDTAALKMGIIIKPSAANQACACIQPYHDRVDLIWLRYVLELMKPKILTQLRKGTKQKNLSLSVIKNMKVPCVPLSLQREFVAIADKAESAKANLKKSIAAIDQVMKGLING